MSTFALKILTPEKDYLTMKQVDVLLASSIETGAFSLYANHVDLIAGIAICPLEIRYNGHITFYAFGGGTLQFEQNKNQATLLCEEIFSLDEIDVDKIKEDKIAYENKLKETTYPLYRMEIEKQIQRLNNCLFVKEHYHNR